MQLPYGISIEIPSHWEVLSEDAKKNLAAASELTKQDLSIDINGERKQLLAVSALPIPSGAKIRVSVTSPAEFTEDDLYAISDSELKQLQHQLYAMFSKAVEPSGLKIIEMRPPRIERVKNNLAFVIDYIRTDYYGSSYWQVTQYKIHKLNKNIELTLSYRLSDAVVWKAILENVKRSIDF